MSAKTVLITGCSSGIGAALSLELHRRGHRVFATARRPDSLGPLAEKGVETLTLDVNDDTSIAAAMAAVRDAAGSLDILVNNAGFSQVGAIVDLRREDLRAQYETNVIAPVVVVSEGLELLRAAVAASGCATLVNVGSIVGTFTTPFAGAYCSSKSALHSLSDALRMELLPLGISVVTVQPGGIRSAFGDHAEEAIQLPEDSLFKSVERGIRARAQAGQQGATPAEEFVVQVADGILRDEPPVVIRGGKNSLRLPLLQKLLPTRTFDAMMRKNFGLNRLQP